ncbi:MAG: alpha/beta-type small acid-soluble spore protein [Firmicutes bacterium]|mgnify:CR=1 FL=1|nr:alpha/beta-type small acid-soluble spore protein [Bacillota bacterium]
MANGGRKKKRLVPGVEQALEKFKMEIAQELGITNSANSWETALEQYKHEIASELGIDTYIRQKGWQNVPSALCGSVGGRIGGRIGGNMVKRMIEMAEKELAQKNY